MSSLYSTVSRSQTNRAPLECDGIPNLPHECAADKSSMTVWSCHINMNQKFWWFQIYDELKQFWMQKEIQHNVSNVDLMKCIFAV